MKYRTRVLVAVLGALLASAVVQLLFEVSRAGGARGIAILAVGTSALFGAAVGAALVRREAGPVTELAGFAKKLLAGVLHARVAPKGAPEIRVLADALNRMAADLGGVHKVKEERERLQAEMSLAARVQGALVPKTTTLRGFEIAARMVPATEAGGDYYDVLPVEDGCWVAIGDVSGHGLSAGLISLMVQSVMAALVTSFPSSTPKPLVAAANTVLYEFVRKRLEQREHVTLTLLRFGLDGHVTYAGAHEDILVLGMQDAACQKIPTPGTWLCLKKEMSQTLVEGSLQLGEGDLLVLYTDGVIEARSSGGKRFETERLAQAIEEVRDAPVEKIRDHVLGKVDQWMARQDDDTTLLVIRYLGPNAESVMLPAAALRRVGAPKESV